MHGLGVAASGAGVGHLALGHCKKLTMSCCCQAHFRHSPPNLSSQHAPSSLRSVAEATPHSAPVHFV